MVWEKDDGTSVPKSAPALVAVTGGFHTETGRTRAGDLLIVCNSCDTIQETD